MISNSPWAALLEPPTELCDYNNKWWALFDNRRKDIKMAYVLTTYPREGERTRTSPASRHQGLHLDSHNLHHLLLLDQGLLLLGQLLLLLAHQSLHVLMAPPFFSHLILHRAICFVMIVATKNMKQSVDWGG
jgi:hypothetical protein